MALFRKLEDFLSNRADGFLNRKFSRALCLSDVEKRLGEELRLKKFVDQGLFYIPDSFTVILAETDYQQLEQLATYQQLYRYIMQAAIRNDFYLKHDPTLQLAHNMIKDKGTFSVQSALSEETAFTEDTGDLGHTIVFQKGFVKKMNIDYSKVTFAGLAIRKGKDKGFSLAIGKKRIHIGRRETNELALHDISCSRLHAYIDFENYRHVVYDADSMNGTYVNGRLIRSQVLKIGDEITVGSTVIVYGVDPV